MLSSEQYEEKKSKVLKCVEIYLSDESITEAEVSKITGISQSSIDRYLKDEQFIKECFPLEYKEIIEKINNKLMSNKASSKATGGNNFAKNNIATKDENGLFTGSKKKSEEVDMEFLAKLALEYRLSLKNICRLIGIEANDENKLEIKNKILSGINDYDLKTAYNYLFDYETLVESKEVSDAAYKNAMIVFAIYNCSKEQGNLDSLKTVLKDLSKTDIDFIKLKKQTDFSNPLTDKQVEIISKYRIKHCISINGMECYLCMERDRLARAENRIKNPILKAKIEMLADYYAGIAKAAMHRRNK